MRTVLRSLTGLAALLWGASALAQVPPTAMATFSFAERPNVPPLLLKEIEHRERLSVFEASGPAYTRPQAMFVLCSFARFAEHRGYSHIAVMQPAKGQDNYVLGLFNADSDDLAAVFGKELDPKRILGDKPGAVAKLLPLCPAKTAKPSGE